MAEEGEASSWSLVFWTSDGATNGIFEPFLAIFRSGFGFGAETEDMINEQFNEGHGRLVHCAIIDEAESRMWISETIFTEYIGWRIRVLLLCCPIQCLNTLQALFDNGGQIPTGLQ